MKAGRTSRTAEIAAASRAIHSLIAFPPVFEDGFALALTSPSWRRIATVRPLRWFVTGVLLRAMRPVGVQVVCRSRYAEDLLDRAIAAGVDQYVIVGAGFDSFALRRRDLVRRLRIFELDHPDTQRTKRSRLRDLDVEIPDNLEFVGIDFERETVGEGLIRSRFEPRRRAFFSWLGTTAYLSTAATLGTLAAISKLSAPQSEIAFDYLVPESILSDEEARILKKLRRFTARRGEPLIGELDPRELPDVLRSVGFELMENLSGREQERRYFSGRRDGLRPMASAYIAHARISSPAG